MEKLELKHLSPYLPYGLKLKSPLKTSNWPPNKTYEMFEDNNCFSPLLGISDAFHYQYRPILRPITNLSKEIEINGRKIEPIKQLSREGVFFDDTPISNMYDDYREWSVWEYETLISWHFDVFGLIEKGLAIDKNTL